MLCFFSRGFYRVCHYCAGSRAHSFFFFFNDPAPTEISPLSLHAPLPILEENLDHIRASPADNGTVELIARRPEVDGREVLAEALLDPQDGLLGDTWRVRGSTRTPNGRSEEHTSELQSPCNLVCRLLLEKK